MVRSLISTRRYVPPARAAHHVRAWRRLAVSTDPVLMLHAALQEAGKNAGIELDRKSLAELAAREPAAFAKLAEKAKAAAA